MSSTLDPSPAPSISLDAVRGLLQSARTWTIVHPNGLVIDALLDGLTNEESTTLTRGDLLTLYRAIGYIHLAWYLYKPPEQRPADPGAIIDAAIRYLQPKHPRKGR